MIRATTPPVRSPKQPGGHRARGQDDMKHLAALIPGLVFFALAPAAASSVTPGLYRDSSNHLIYVGLDEEPPDSIINYYDPLTGMDGAISDFRSLHLVK